MNCSLDYLTREGIAEEFRLIEELIDNPTLRRVLDGSSTLCVELERWYDLKYSRKYCLGELKTSPFCLGKEDRKKLGKSPNHLIGLLNKFRCTQLNETKLQYEAIRNSMRIPIWNLGNNIVEYGVVGSASIGLTALITGVIAGSESLKVGGAALAFVGPFVSLSVGLLVEVPVQIAYSIIPKLCKSLETLKEVDKFYESCEAVDSIVSRYNYLHKKGLKPQ